MSSSVGEFATVRKAIEQIEEDNLKIAKINAILLLNAFESVLDKKLDSILEMTKKLKGDKNEQ